MAFCQATCGMDVAGCTGRETRPWVRSGVQVMAGGDGKAVRVGAAGDEPVSVDVEDLGETDEFDGGEGSAVAHRFGEFLVGQADLRGDLGLGAGVRGDAVGDALRDAFLALHGYDATGSCDLHNSP